MGKIKGNKGENRKKTGANMKGQICWTQKSFGWSKLEWHREAGLSATKHDFFLNTYEIGVMKYVPMYKLRGERRNYCFYRRCEQSKTKKG